MSRVRGGNATLNPLAPPRIPCRGLSFGSPAGRCSMSSDLLPSLSSPADGFPPALEALTQRLGLSLAGQLDLAALQAIPEPNRRDELRLLATRLVVAEEPSLSPEHRAEVVRNLLDELVGLGPLDRLLRLPGVGDILVNGPREVWLDRGGVLEASPVVFRDDDHLMQVIERVVSRVGRRIDDTSPMVDARLPDGSRLNAIIPPLSLKGPALSVRRFSPTPLTMDRLLGLKALAPEMAALLEATVKGRLNVVVSGGTGSGKTTLLNALSSHIPDSERVITIEDAAELRLQQRHVLPLETRPPNVEGRNGVPMRDLLRNALRMRPDRIIVGECRGPEALDMLQAMNTGHEGSMTTLHANSPRDALIRLETMLLMAGYEVPLKALRRQIASAVDLVVQADRLAGGARRVTAITEVVGMEGDVLVTQDVFAFQQSGVDAAGRAIGQFVATGVRPTFAAKLKASGQDLPPPLFMQRVLLRA
ncbi:MAG: CpaF family protein [Gemmataceae bacterium]|nr:CpaF family protein [Gemmataceae bacterium]